MKISDNYQVMDEIYDGGFKITSYIKTLPEENENLPMNKRLLNLMKYIRDMHPELN